MEHATALVIGAGGLGSEILEGLVRKGIGHARVFDHDVVELSNLNRQHFFRRDIGKHKALQLVSNLANHATCGTTLEGHALSFQDASALGVDLTADVGVWGVDNDPARVAGCRFCLRQGMPGVFVAVDDVAENGYVFVHEPGKACFVCAFPDALGNSRTPCGAAAVKDILKVVAGLALYAVDALLMDRKRSWNYRNVHLAGFAPSQVLTIERRDDCPVCGRVNSSVTR